MANDAPRRQPFVGSCTANSTAVDSGIGEIGPVPAKKRLAVESVSVELVTSTSGALYSMQLNSPFTLFMIPALITDGVFNLKRYYATHAIRFYVESGQLIQFQVATTCDAGHATCFVSGYFLDR
jgi:hypothetical protein